MSFWDKFAGLYDLAESFNKKVYKQMTDYVEKLTPNGAKVLDCAAGTGELSLAAAKKAKTVMCTDVSENMLLKSSKKARKKGVKNIRFEVRDIFHLRDKDETYDVVIAGNVLHLLYDPQAAIYELFRVTKKGGRLLLPTFSTGGKKHLLISLYKLIGFKPEKEYTPKEYVKMLKNCNLGSVKAKTIKGRIPCCFAVIYKSK